MFLIIGHHIHHGKAVLVRQVIDDSRLFGISPVPVNEILQHVLIAFQQMAHTVEKPFVVLRHIFKCRYFPLIEISAVHIVKEELCSGKQRIPYQDFLADAAPHQMKSIHMVLKLPVTQNIQHNRRTYRTVKIEFHQTLHPCLVQSIHQM